ncbi:MAG: TonB-dependent receptor [Flavobacteriaceae bacterium]|nr:TonB-dependent receptor [Flavobacteriaceae bacterium]
MFLKFKRYDVTFLFLVIILITQHTFSQNVKGIVLDEEKKPLEFVSIALLQPKDSLLVKYTSTDGKGMFNLSEIKDGDYLIQVYLMTYEPLQKMIIFKNKEIDLGLIELKNEIKRLNEIVINAIIPIQIKQDTVAFNSKAFKIRQDDNVEDLIKKLPGVEISTDGTVNAQGKDITKILVDGKEFFSNDMSIALKNLNADAIKSIQIIDEESDDTRVTGIKDGEKNKIINLVLKEGKKTGYFGKFGAGLGTNERYSTNVDINRFTQKSQLAVFGKLNNINNTGATVFNRDGSRDSNKSGFLTTGTTGANYNYEFKKDLDFNIDYHYGYSDNQQEESSNRTEFTNNTTFSSEKENKSENISNNHNLNFSLRDRSKKDAYLELRGDFKNDIREANNSNSSVYFDENAIENTNSIGNSSSKDDRNNGGLSFSYRKKMNEKGRNFRFGSGISFSNSNDTDYQKLLSTFNVDDVSTKYELDEETIRNEKNKSLNYKASLRYMEPIVEHHFISFSTNINAKNSDELLNQNKAINSVDQNLFRYNTDYNTQSFENQLGYVYSNDKFQVYLSGSFENLDQKLDLESGNVVDNNYSNLVPKAMISYEFKKGKRIRFRYNKSIDLPSSSQVSPVVNNFNPFYISVGNVALTPEESDEYSFMFYSHNFTSATSFFSSLNYSNTTNAIVTNRAIDTETYIQNSTFENYGSKSNLRGNIYFSRKIKKFGIRYNVRLNANLDEYVTIIDDAYNKTNSKNSGFGLSLSNENKNNIDLTVGANFDVNKTTYSLQKKNRDYFKQNYFTKLDWDITNSLNFNSQFDYSLYTDNNFDSQTVPIWNVALEYAFLKGKRGNLKLQVLDILDKDVDIDRSSSANYFQETFRKNLGTYAMLSFTYSIKPPTGKNSKRDSGKSRRHEH